MDIYKFGKEFDNLPTEQIISVQNYKIRQTDNLETERNYSKAGEEKSLENSITPRIVIEAPIEFSENSKESPSQIHKYNSSGINHQNLSQNGDDKIEMLPIMEPEETGHLNLFSEQTGYHTSVNDGSRINYVKRLIDELDLNSGPRIPREFGLSKREKEIQKEAELLKIEREMEKLEREKKKFKRLLSAKLKISIKTRVLKDKLL